MYFEEDGICRLNGALKEIEGYLTIGEAVALHSLARHCSGAGVIVEIGSYKGRSTISLGLGSKEGKNIKIYAIDPHTGFTKKPSMTKNKIRTFDFFKKNISRAGIDDIIVPVVMTSKDAAADFTQPVELIFIDGDHDYDFVKKDFEMWFPKVINGGIIAFHDADWSGPGRVIRRYICRSRHFKNLEFVDSLAVSMKVSTNTFKDRIKNRYKYFRFTKQDLIEKLPVQVRSAGRKLAKAFRLK